MFFFFEPLNMQIYTQKQTNEPSAILRESLSVFNSWGYL